MKSWRWTLKDTLAIEGPGIHSGKVARMVISPDLSDTIFFYRTKKGKKEKIPLHPSSVSGAWRYTAIGFHPPLRTVEHFLSACYGLSLAGLKVEVEGEELPGGDGSAAFFCDLFLKCGRRRKGELSFFSLKTPFLVRNKKSFIVAYPYSCLRILFFLYPPYPGQAPQVYDLSFSEKGYLEEIAPARTFCTYREIQALRQQKLGQGGNLQNTLVITRRGYYNKPRFPDEPVRHKILDFLGDLAFFPARPKALFLCLGSGHALNHKLVAALYQKAGKA